MVDVVGWKEEDETVQKEKKNIKAALDHLRLLNEKFMNSTNENTFLLNQLTKLTERQYLSEKMLDRNEQNKDKYDKGTHDANHEELFHLRKKSESQKMYIKALQVEIFHLKHKTGNIRMN
jgi:hypothetical protein